MSEARQSVSTGTVPMMKAAVIRKTGGTCSLVLEQRARPFPGPGEVLVRMRALSINYRDRMLAQGHIPVDDGRIPMTDGSGDIVALGEGVDMWAIGDAVMSQFFPQWQAGKATAEVVAEVTGQQKDGVAAEYIAVPAMAVTAIPDSWSHVEAATLPCAGLTAWRALMVEADLRPGEYVLVQGTGGVAIFALQFALAAGAQVIATSSSPAKAKRLKSMGAKAVINYRETPEWGADVRRLTGGRGVDAVIDLGGAATLGQSLSAVRTGGTVLMVGAMSGWTGPVATGVAIMNNINMQGMTVGSRADQQDMVRALEASRIRPIVDATFPFDLLADAFALQASGDHFGKICVTFD